jgi:hypothetical protein
MQCMMNRNTKILGHVISNRISWNQSTNLHQVSIHRYVSFWLFWNSIQLHRIRNSFHWFVFHFVEIVSHIIQGLQPAISATVWQRSDNYFFATINTTVTVGNSDCTTLTQLQQYSTGKIFK